MGGNGRFADLDIVHISTAAVRDGLLLAPRWLNSSLSESQCASQCSADTLIPLDPIAMRLSNASNLLVAMLDKLLVLRSGGFEVSTYLRPVASIQLDTFKRQGLVCSEPVHICVRPPQNPTIRPGTGHQPPRSVHSGRSSVSPECVPTLGGSWNKATENPGCDKGSTLSR
jgi:hypothetical protein